MDAPQYSTSLIVGAGSGLSASLARLFAREGLRVALAARQTDKLAELCRETSARAFACDAINRDEVKRLFDEVEAELGAPDVVVYNASASTRAAPRRRGPSCGPEISWRCASRWKSHPAMQVAPRQFWPATHASCRDCGAPGGEEAHTDSLCGKRRWGIGGDRRGHRAYHPRHWRNRRTLLHDRSCCILAFAHSRWPPLLIEVVLDRGVDGAEFLQRLHAPKPKHRTFSSSERLMRVFCAIVHPAPAFRPVRITNDFHRCAIGAEAVRYDAMWFAVFLHEALE